MRQQLLRFTTLATMLALLALPGAQAQELFREAFDNSSSGSNWGTNASSSDTSAIFGYNYGTNESIPEAPNTRGGDTATSGVILEANIDNPTGAEVLTLYPTGQNFTGNYQLRFDAWMNYDVNEFNNGGAVGTTEFLGGGVGYDNTKVDVGSGIQTIATGDGGSGSDWRAFKDRTTAGGDAAFFVDGEDMAAGTRQGSNAYYADFLPGVAPPAGQSQDVFEPGTAGSPGFQWVTWEFRAIDNVVDVTIEKPDGSRLLIVSLDAQDTSDGSLGFTTDGNISLVYADFFSSVSPRADLTFGVVDNVEVSVSSGMYGDYNDDGNVDLEDYTVWRDNLGAPAGTLDNDPNNSDVGTAQYALWKQNFGRSLNVNAAASAVIPEPATTALVAGGVAMVLLARRRTA